MSCWILLQHLWFFGRLKGKKGSDLKDEVRNLLKGVKLYEVRNKAAFKYSGGMRRRLAVAICESLFLRSISPPL